MVNLSSTTYTAAFWIGRTYWEKKKMSRSTSILRKWRRSGGSSEMPKQILYLMLKGLGKTLEIKETDRTPNEHNVQSWLRRALQRRREPLSLYPGLRTIMPLEPCSSAQPPAPGRTQAGIATAEPHPKRPLSRIDTHWPLSNRFSHLCRHCEWPPSGTGLLFEGI